MKFKIFISAIFLTFNLWGQNHDFNWLLGSGDDNNLLNFNTTPFTIDRQTRPMGMEGSNTSMSDAEGNLLFYSNGCYIADSSHDTMRNGGIIGPGELQDFFCDGGGSPWRQGVISIPAPSSDSIYYVFNIDMNTPFFGHPSFLSIAPYHLYYQKINMNRNNGLGEVVVNNGIAVKDTLAHTSIQAVRHANGEDWWVIAPKLHSNCYWLVLVTAAGVQPAELKCDGKEWSDYDFGQAVFTPNLKKYIRYSFYNGVHIYDFDNETGALSNSIHIDTPTDDSTTLGGAALSPNSRFLYITHPFRVSQYDLESNDIEGSKVKIAEWDGFANPFATIFYLAALAPDGKIYISSTSSTKNLHVIHYPDCKGLASSLEQHGIDLPAFNFASIPNFPHYRNEPSDINCDTVFVSLNETKNKFVEIKIYPNPSYGKFTVAFSEPVTGYFYLYDVAGKEVQRILIAENQKRLHVQPYPNLKGLYFYEIKENGITKTTGKVFLN